MTILRSLLAGSNAGADEAASDQPQMDTGRQVALPVHQDHAVLIRGDAQLCRLPTNQPPFLWALTPNLLME